MNWHDFLQNTNWSFFEVLVGVIGIIVSALVAYHIFFREKKKKSLSYELLTNTELISVGEEAKGRLEILFDGKPVKDVKLLIIELVNDGNIPVLSSDFEIPIIFTFGTKTEIIIAEVNKTSNKSLEPKIDIVETQVNIEPILLNPNDSFEVKILLTVQEEEIEAKSRIAGIQEIREKDVLYGVRWFIRILTIITFLTIAYGIYIFIKLVLILLFDTFLEELPFSRTVAVALTSGIISLIVSIKFFKFLTKDLQKDKHKYLRNSRLNANSQTDRV